MTIHQLRGVGVEAVAITSLKSRVFSESQTLTMAKMFNIPNPRNAHKNDGIIHFRISNEKFSSLSLVNCVFVYCYRVCRHMMDRLTLQLYCLAGKARDFITFLPVNFAELDIKVKLLSSLTAPKTPAAAVLSFLF